jgi:hypothetical protein
MKDCKRLPTPLRVPQTNRNRYFRQGRYRREAGLQAVWRRAG